LTPSSPPSPASATPSKTPASASAPITTAHPGNLDRRPHLARRRPDQSSAILQHHLDVFIGYDKNAVEFEETETKQDDEKAKLKKLLNMSVNEIELSVRAANCLNNANITTVGQLAMKTEAEMLKYRNFGKKSLNEIKEKLASLGLSLGMNIDQTLLEAPKEEVKPRRLPQNKFALMRHLNAPPNSDAPAPTATACWPTWFAA
jgi:hypothetical protein